MSDVQEAIRKLEKRIAISKAVLKQFKLVRRNRELQEAYVQGLEVGLEILVGEKKESK